MQILRVEDIYVLQYIVLDKVILSRSFRDDFKAVSQYGFLVEWQ